MADEYESGLTASRAEIAAVLGGVVDGITAGAVRLEGEESTLVVEIPAELELEIEFEMDDDEQSLELELEWQTTDAEGEKAAVDADTPAEHSLDSKDGDVEIEDTLVDTEAEHSSPVEAADPVQTHARFELFRDRSNEWRWRLRHRNGNIIATSGEGYTQKHNAKKGLKSVMQNADGAVITEEDESEEK